MAELFAETTVAHVPGFPQFLREVWDHLYPGTPPPTYRVYYNRLDRSTSEFTATVHLRPEPSLPVSLLRQYEPYRRLQEMPSSSFVPTTPS
jgi:hypothetical protein